MIHQKGSIYTFHKKRDLAAPKKVRTNLPLTWQIEAEFPY